MSQFLFLQAEWPLLFEAASEAEGDAHGDARVSCFYARRALEIAVAWLYRHDRSLKQPYQDNLSAWIHEPTFRTAVGDALFTKARLIKDLGNRAVHDARRIEASEALTTTRELFHFTYWLARTYGRQQRPAPDLTFSAALLPRPASVAPQTPAQLQALEAKLKASDQALAQARAENSALNEELQALREAIAAAKKANSAEPDTHDYSEAETRSAFIDLLLKEAGWQLDAKNFEVEVDGMPNGEGKGYVDYVLWGDDGRPLALIEAKRTTRNPAVGRQQAKLYADCLQAQFGRRPVIFYSNGYEHWIWDDLNDPPRPVQGFYKKAELERMVQRRSSRRPLAETTIDGRIIERYYQTRAVRRVGEHFEVDRQRRALLVMATGSGKTRTVIALTDVLMRSNWVKRVLFLADRVALVNQAVKAFKTHLPDAAPVNLVTDRHAEGRVFVSTYPTMMGLIDEVHDGHDGQRRFGVGHFDLIVIDEAHRSVYQKYRAIFDYFDALLVGLTATPKDEIDRNTYGLFELETGVPTDAYGLDEAVADGHLVPPVAVSVPLRFMRDGIRYDDLSEDEKEQWDAQEWNDEGTVPAEVDPAELNRWLFNEDTVDKALALLMTHGQKVAGGDRLGKTIVFAKNNDHADFIARRFDANYPQYAGHFARVVTYRTEYAQSLIDDFSTPARMPHIAVSVDMLDTGIDVPEVVNLVFFKVVRSKTKFWQMLGRGTRLCPDLFGPGEHKKNFLVFDFCQNLEFFSQNPATSDGALGEALGTRLFRARLDMIGELDRRQRETVQEARAPFGDDPTETQLRDDIAGLLHAKVAAMNVDNFVVRPYRRVVDTYAQAQAWQRLDADALDVLRRELADLPSALSDDDEDAKRFDLLALRTQLAVLQALPEFAALRERMRAIAGALEEQPAIPAIRAEMVLIQAVAGEEWWQDVTVGMLETARRRLRALVKLIPKGQKKIVYTDFEAELGEAVTVDLPQVTAGLDMNRFKDKARQFLKAHESHVSLQRLRRNQALTPADLLELERMLVEAGGTRPLIDAAASKFHGLGLFIRSLVGLDREAAMQAFSGFIQGTSATPAQIEFIDLMIGELTRTGVMEADRLFQSPFTDVHAQGPLGVFPPARVTELVRILDEVKARAVA